MDEDAGENARVIEDLENPNLEALQFDQENTGVMTGYAVCMQIRTKPTLTHLCLNRLKIGYDGMQMIADELAVNTTVQSVSMCGVGLQGYRVGVKPWNSILLPLSKCQSLTELDLSMNELQHAKDGLCVLLRNSPVQKLTLPCWSNKLNEALLDNTSLRHLEFFHLRQHSFYLSDILDALISPRCTLQSIDLFEFKYDEDSLKRLAGYYKNPDTYCLEQLDLRCISQVRKPFPLMTYDNFLRMWIDVMNENPSLRVLVKYDNTSRIKAGLMKQISDLFAQDQRQLQTEMPKAAHVAAKRARTE